MSKILIICEDLRINNTSAGIGRSKLINIIAQTVNQVDVIVPNNFDYPVTWLPKNVNVNLITFPEVKTPYLFSISKIKALYTYFFGLNYQDNIKKNRYKKYILELINKKEYDLIYLLASGNSFIPYYIFPSSEINIPYIANIHDPYPMHAYPEPYKHKTSIVYKKQQRIFNKVLEGAHKITFPSKYLLEHMATFFPVIKQKGIVIPHIGISLTNLQGGENDGKVTLPLNKINIIHAGNLLGPRNPQYLIQAISELNSENKEFENEVLFTFFGTFNKEHKLLIQKTNISNIIFNETRVSYKKSTELMAQADANLVIEAISDFSPFLPGKVADIGYSGKPIIALTPQKSEVNRVLGNNYPYTSTLDNVKQIKNILLNFYYNYKANKIDPSYSNKLKQYVSIDENIKITKSFLDIK